MDNKESPRGFIHPTALPKNSQEADQWQRENKEWWQRHPMRYDWKSQLGCGEFSREFFEEIDRRFFGDAREYLQSHSLPFDDLIRFRALADKDVLEVGVGNGSHAALLAQHSQSFTGIDITDYACESTRKRFEIFGLSGSIQQADVEHLPFPDSSFDFVWSWGVIHHSANTKNALKEIHRVLRPGGRAIVMVYHRGWWNYYIFSFLASLLSGDFRPGFLHHGIQKKTDGAIARYYSFRGWRAVVGDLFDVESLFSLGPKSDVILLPAGSVKERFKEFLPVRLNIFLTRRFHMGSFLVSCLRKKA